MKKIVFSFMLFFLILPIYDASADTFSIDEIKSDTDLVNLIDGVLFEDLTGSAVDLSNMTDGDKSTRARIPTLKNGGSLGVKYKFLKPVSINGYFHISSNTTGLLIFETKTGDIFEYKVTGESDVTELNLKDVVSVMIRNQTSNYLYINLFEIYGYKNSSLPVTNLKELTTYNSTTLSWDNPKNTFENIIIKKDGVNIAELGNVKSYTINSLTPETDYNFEVIVKYSEDDFSIGKKISVRTLEVPDDTTPPAEISSLSVSPTSFDATFAWINPTDSDFDHIRIYRDGELIESRHTLNTYNAIGLIPNKLYVFKFVTVDENGNNSAGYVQSVKTNPEFDNIAPDAPIGVSLYDGNASGVVNWTRNTESDLYGYNVYLNGVKHNTSPIFSTSYVINNLDNGVNYEVNVSAVDTSDNESALSATQILNPDESSMPVFTAGYDLKDVANGTSNWFNTLWPILAFGVGIPLAFIVSFRVKTLFFA